MDGVDLTFARWQMGLSLGLPHHLRGDRHGDAGDDGRGGSRVAAHRPTRVPRPGQALGHAARPSCSPSARCPARCCRSSSGCCGRRSWSSPGPIIGMPFSLEGFAFFLEAIFLGVYLYGWHKLRPRGARVRRRHGRRHRRRAVGAFVVTANAWMNTPAGFRVVDGQLGRHRSVRGDVQPGGRRAGRCTCCWPRTPRSASASPASTRGCCCAIPTTRFIAARFVIALVVGAAGRRCSSRSSGDWAGRVVARTQPAKLAALEGQFATETYAPLRIGGIPRRRRARDALRARDSRRPELAGAWRSGARR